MGMLQNKSEGGLEVGTELHGALLSEFTSPHSAGGTHVTEHERLCLEHSRQNCAAWDEQVGIDLWTQQVRRRGLVAVAKPNKPLRLHLKAYQSQEDEPKKTPPTIIARIVKSKRKPPPGEAKSGSRRQQNNR